MNFFPLIDLVRRQAPGAVVMRVSLFATGVASVTYRMQGQTHALHVWPDGRYVWRPSRTTKPLDGRAIGEIATYLQENAATLWLVSHVGHLQGVVMADNVRMAQRELHAVCRPWQRANDDKYTHWPLAYAMAVIARVSGVRYGIKALHLLPSGAVVASITGGQQVMLMRGGLLRRADVRRRDGWEGVEVDKIGTLLHHNWRTAVRFVDKAWRKQLCA